MEKFICTKYETRPSALVAGFDGAAGRGTGTLSSLSEFDDESLLLCFL